MTRAFTLLTAIAAVVLAACGANDSGPAAPVSQDPQVRAGFQVASTKGCFGCHQAGGKGGRSGPAFDGLAGSTVQLDGGSTKTADEAYLRRAIVDPDADIAKGYPRGVMSSVMSNTELTGEQITQLVAYLNAR